MKVSLPMNAYVLLQEGPRGTDSSMLALIIKARRFLNDEPCTGGIGDGDGDASLQDSVPGPPWSSLWLTLVRMMLTPSAGVGSVI
ncbi:hypothetical protein ACOMHN_005227 [Nucella lapillus]